MIGRVNAALERTVVVVVVVEITFRVQVGESSLPNGCYGRLLTIISWAP